MRVRVAHLGTPYLNVVITVVVKVEDSVDFRVAPNSEVFGVFHALRNRLSRIFLHLDVVELPETTKQMTHDYAILVQFYQSRGVADDIFSNVFFFFL